MNTLTKIKQLSIVGLLLLGSCGREDAPDPIIPPSDGSTLTLQGGEGGNDAINAVYVDLSSDEQTAVERDSWTLGFYTGDDFRVILNNQTGVAAMATGQSDISDVNVSNTDLSQLTYDHTPENLSLYDDTLGRLEHTVIDEIKADEGDNQVYLLNTVHGSSVEAENVWKVKIDRNLDGGYQLQYAKLADTDIQTLSIQKDGDYNFSFVSLSAGQVGVEPAKEDWDFVWSKSMFFTSMGGDPIPYFYSDMVFTNSLAGVEAAEVITQGDQPSYQEFDESHLSEITFSDSRNVISSHWRVTTNDIGVLEDRFYLIRDASGNVYKLKFLVMGVDDSGRRGYPEIEYKLIKSN